MFCGAEPQERFRSGVGPIACLTTDNPFAVLMAVPLNGVTLGNLAACGCSRDSPHFRLQRDTLPQSHGRTRLTLVDRGTSPPFAQANKILSIATPTEDAPASSPNQEGFCVVCSEYAGRSEGHARSHWRQVDRGTLRTDPGTIPPHAAAERAVGPLRDGGAA